MHTLSFCSVYFRKLILLRAHFVVITKHEKIFGVKIVDLEDRVTNYFITKTCLNIIQEKEIVYLFLYPQLSHS